jgi:hypothetical protein
VDAVREIMPAALSELLRRAPLSSDKVLLAWRVAVGPALARATTVELRGDTLHIRAKDPVWQREIERSAVLIRARLIALLGDTVARQISVTTL